MKKKAYVRVLITADTLLFSDLQDPELSEHCPHQHKVRCIESEQLKVTLKSIADQIESPSINYYSGEQKEDFKHDLAQAREMFFQWKSQI